MKNIVRLSLIAPAMIFAASQSMAIENIKTVCTHDTQTRIIEVVYEGESEVPCAVQYTKAEGSQTLWNAQNAMGYCEEKAAAFVEKQRGWGWDCQNSSAATEEADENVIESAATEESAAADDKTATAEETTAAVENAATEEAAADTAVTATAE